MSNQKKGNKMPVGETTIILPEDNKIEIVAPPADVDRVPTSNLKSHKTKRDSVEMTIVKGYAEQHITSINALASAFAKYMADLSSLQNNVFLVNPEGDE